MPSMARVLVDKRSIDAVSRSLQVPLLGFDNIDVEEVYVDGARIVSNDFNVKADRIQFGNAVVLRETSEVIVFLQGNPRRARLEKWIPVFVALIALFGNLFQFVWRSPTPRETQALVNVTHYGPVKRDQQKKFIFTISKSEPSVASNIVSAKEAQDGLFWFGLRKKDADDPQDVLLAGGPIKLTTAQSLELDLPPDLATAYFEKCESVQLVGLLVPKPSKQVDLNFQKGSKIKVRDWLEHLKVVFAVSNNLCS
jgi:hypothetical protein